MAIAKRRTAAGAAWYDDALLSEAWVDAALGADWFGPGRRPVPALPHKQGLSLVEGPEGMLVAKRERLHGGRKLGLRPSRTRRAFDGGLDLAGRGLSVTPRARLVCADVEVLLVDHVSAPNVNEALAAGELRAEEAHLGALADFVRELHGAGYTHRDLKAPNLLWLPGPWVQLVDLDDLRRRAPRRARDLGRLAVSLLHTEVGVAAGFDE
ncbi:MAG: hypothetical protein O2816_16795, partial [Planctomycetota bacterium]|nr:hypothetical protein [Planctomycetota bacterium]